MQLLVLLSGELASIKVNKKKTESTSNNKKKLVSLYVCLTFFNAEIGERSCDSSPDTRFHSVVQACDFMCI